MRGRDINWEIEAGREGLLEIKPMQDSGEPWDFRNAVVNGSLRDVRTDEELEVLTCGVTDDGLVTVSFPEKDSGQYVFVVDISGEDGGSTRLVEGYVTWTEPRAVLSGIEESEEKCLLVFVNERRRRIAWAWSTEAEQQYKRAKAEAEKAAESAEQAKKSAESVNGSIQVQLLGEVNAALKEFDFKVQNAIKVNHATNTWVIGGVDIKTPVTGESGKSPEISVDGTWLTWDNVTQEWVDTGKKAVGKDGQDGRDGINGDALRRVLLDSMEQLPEIPSEDAELDELRRYLYLIPKESGDYDMYGLLETANNTYAWVNVGDSNTIATHLLYGLVKLGTSEVISNGAPVGINADGGLVIRLAGTTTAGAATISHAAVIHENTRCIGFNELRQLTVSPAKNAVYGAVKAGEEVTVYHRLPYTMWNGVYKTENLDDVSNGKMVCNLLVGGALKWMRAGSGDTAWTADKMQGGEYETLGSGSGYLGLHLTESFAQNEKEGLVLKDATPTVKGGVYMDSESTDNTVMSATQTRNLLTYIVSDALANYYPKTEVYTKQEVTNAINGAYDSIVEAVSQNIFKEVSADEYAELTPENNILYLIPE